MTDDERHLQWRCDRFRTVLGIPLSVAHTTTWHVRINETIVLAAETFGEVKAYLDGVEHGAGWILQRPTDTDGGTP